MGLVKINESILNGIASAIRSKLGVDTTYKPSQMASAINSIPVPALQSKSITANGTYTPSGSYNGFSSVSVAVPNSYTAEDEGKVVDNGALVAQTSDSISANGTYDTTLNNEVVVNVPSGGSTLVSKTITENGTYDPTDDNADGYSSVVVNVAGGGGSISALLDEEIKQDSGSTKTLDETVTIPEDGNYYVFAIGYDSATAVYINSVQQTNDYDYSTDYIHAYAKKVTLSKDDTVRINMYGSGHVYIRAFIAKEGSGGGSTLLADWDFTQSLVDSVSGITATLKDATQSSSGVEIGISTSYISLPATIKANARVYELEMGAMSLDGTGNKRLFMVNTSDGLIYRSTGVWGFYNGSWATNTDITNFDYFANSTIRFEIDMNGNWKIYKNGTLVYEPDKTLNMASTGTAYIGSTGNSCTDVIIKGLKVYR